uniref:Putative secreted protein n=1 Tax=Amblyomma cajennense TaxID=34607 RepID=A0A023FC19_AMBCJ
MQSLLAYALCTLVVAVASASRSHCERDIIGASFDYTPDVWQLIKPSNLQFHLMFVSAGRLNTEDYKCLTTLRTETVQHKAWQRKVFYNVCPNSTEPKKTSLEEYSDILGLRKLHIIKVERTRIPSLDCESICGTTSNNSLHMRAHVRNTCRNN